MTLILTNDDGIDAPGIRALQKAVNQKAIIVAPTQEWSGCGHRVTTTEPIEIHQRSQNEYAITGTPADCTRIAITHICPQVKWVLAGINAGGNMGTDVYISGTCAAVREAAMHNIPAIAISHWIKKPLIIDWELAAKWTAEVLSKLLTIPLETGTFWNVNLPHIEPGTPEPEIVFCQPSIDPLPVKYNIEGNKLSYCGEYSKRTRTPGTDVDICFSGKIAITQIRL